MRTRVLLAALFTAVLVQAADAPLLPLPVQWSLMGNGGPEALPGRCEPGIDTTQSVDGQTTYTVRCANDVLASFGGAYQTVQTAQYRGKRVRVSAMLKTTAVEGVAAGQYAHVVGGAGMWLSVGTSGRGMRMDRMPNRTLKGTAGWEQRDFVLDVPQDNNQMFIGFWMQGKGQVWARDFKVEEVAETVAVNFLMDDPQRQTGPDLSLATVTPARPTDRYLPPPPKWLAMGAQGFELCDIGVDVQMQRGGQPNLTIGCAIPQTAIVRQAFEAAPFWGKRIRFSGWIRTENFEPAPSGGGTGGAGLLVTVDPQQSPPVHSNLTGTAAWEHRELVFDVPINSRWLLVGLAASGKGQLWGRDFRFEEVSRDTPVTQ